MRKPKVFISHSTSRLDPSQRPVQVREHLYDLLFRDWEVFLDKKSLEPGELWRNTIQQKLAQADAAVVLVDESSAESDWLATEWNILSYRKANEPSFQLVPLLFSGVDLEDSRFRRLNPMMQSSHYLRDEGGDARALAERVVQWLSPHKVTSAVAEPNVQQNPETRTTMTNRHASTAELAETIEQLSQQHVPPQIPVGETARLAQAFEDAIDRWIDPQEAQWVLPWVGPNCPVLMYAQHLGCELSDKDLAKIRELLSTFENGAFAAQKYQRCGREELVESAPQCEMLLRGMASAIVAGQALAFKLANPVNGHTDFGKAFCTAAAISLKCYERAWSIDGEVPPPYIQPDDVGAGKRDVVDAALNQVLATTPTTLPAYLAVRRVLTFLLRRPLNESRMTEATLLFYYDWGQEGETGTVTFWTERSPAAGFYLDPVSLGLTVLDQQLLGSLRTAWDACTAKADHQPSPDGSLAVRLSPYLPKVDSLAADSAGVIFACGMSAALRGKQIDNNVTVTAVLGEATEQGNDVVLLPVEPNSLKQKLDAAERKGISQVVVQSGQLAQVQRDPPPEVFGAESLEDVFKFVFGDVEMESVLLRHSREVKKNWTARCDDPDDPNGLFHFVEPHYGVPAYVGSAGIGGREQVEGEDGQRTVNLLRWVKDNLNHHRMLLCVPGHQGFGKTVFSLHVQTMISDSSGRRALADGKACLAVRWGRRWPEDYLQELCEAVEPHKGTCHSRDVVDWAIENGRVYLILDALDEVTNADKVNQLAEFSEGPGKRCHVILTTRPFAVDKFQRVLFDVPGWTLAHLDGLDDQQQETLVEDLGERVPHRAGVKHLLRVPLVLSMIRSLTTRQPHFNTPADLFLATHVEHLERLMGKATEPDLPLIHRILATTAFERMLNVDRHVRLSVLQARVERRINQSVPMKTWRLSEQIAELVKWRSNSDGDRAMPASFRNNWLEFYCGYFLANFTDTQALGQAAKFAADPKWYWPWRFAIDLADDAPDEAVLVDSLSLLLAPPLEGARPAELMFRAWPILQASPGGRDAIRRLQSELADVDKPKYALACCPPTSTGGATSAGAHFQLAVYRVTNEQFAQFDRSHQERYETPSELRRPASVNRFQAWMYCRWLGPGFRLPQLAEWDFLANEKMALAAADDSLEDPLDVYPDAIRRDVGIKMPNAWGIHDMPRLFAEWWDDREPADEFADLQVAPIADGFLDLAFESRSYRDVNAANLNLFRVAKSPSPDSA